MKSPNEIRAALIIENSGVSAIAKALGITHSAVSQVIHRKRSNPKIRRKIAKTIHLPYSTVWGEKDAA